MPCRFTQVKKAGKDNQPRIERHSRHDIHRRLGGESRADQRVEQIIHHHAPAGDVAERGMDFLSDIGVGGSGTGIDARHAAIADGGEQHRHHGDQNRGHDVAVRGVADHAIDAHGRGRLDDDHADENEIPQGQRAAKMRLRRRSWPLPRGMNDDALHHPVDHAAGAGIIGIQSLEQAQMIAQQLRRDNFKRRAQGIRQARRDGRDHGIEQFAGFGRDRRCRQDSRSSWRAARAANPVRTAGAADHWRGGKGPAYRFGQTTWARAAIPETFPPSRKRRRRSFPALSAGLPAPSPAAARRRASRCDRGHARPPRGTPGRSRAARSLPVLPHAFTAASTASRWKEEQTRQHQI